MRDAKFRAASAEAQVFEIAKEVKASIKQMGAISRTLDAALRVIMNRGLLGEFSEEMRKSEDTNGDGK